MEDFLNLLVKKIKKGHKWPENFASLWNSFSSAVPRIQWEPLTIPCTLLPPIVKGEIALVDESNQCANNLGLACFKILSFIAGLY